jgi:hypothetical protein
MALKAYFGNEAFKRAAVQLMKDARILGELRQGLGAYWDSQLKVGCMIGILVEGNRHSELETRYGIPESLAQLFDPIFEKLPKDKAQLWPETVLQAIRPGADLSGVAAKYAAWLLVGDFGAAHMAVMAPVFAGFGDPSLPELESTNQEVLHIGQEIVPVIKRVAELLEGGITDPEQWRVPRREAIRLSAKAYHLYVLEVMRELDDKVLAKRRVAGLAALHEAARSAADVAVAIDVAKPDMASRVALAAAAAFKWFCVLVAVNNQAQPDGDEFDLDAVAAKAKASSHDYVWTGFGDKLVEMLGAVTV